MFCYLMGVGNHQVQSAGATDSALRENTKGLAASPSPLRQYGCSCAAFH